MHHSRYIHLIILITLLLISACAKPKLDPVQDSHEADRVWQIYAKNAEEITPFRTQLSLRYGTEGDTRRVTALLWGNDSQEIRLDVNAGIGVNIAKLLENKQLFLLYIPREEVAYYHQGTQKPLFNAGVPVPFNLQQLTQLIEGQYSAVFGLEHEGQVQTARDDNSSLPASTFSLSQGPFMGKLTLNAQGLPIFWQENNKLGWSLSLGYKDDSTTPYKLSMIHAEEGKSAILLIKNREYNLAPFTAGQMNLILPHDIETLPLKQVQDL